MHRYAIFFQQDMIVTVNKFPHRAFDINYDAHDSILPLFMIHAINPLYSPNTFFSSKLSQPEFFCSFSHPLITDISFRRSIAISGNMRNLLLYNFVIKTGYAGQAEVNQKLMQIPDFVC